MIRPLYRTACLDAPIALLLLFTSVLAFAQHQLTFTPYRASGIYSIDEVVGWNIRPAENATLLHYFYTVKRNNTDIVRSGHIDLSAGFATIEVQLNEPAMILVEVVAEREAGSLSLRANPEGKLAPSGSDSAIADRKPIPEATLGAAIAPTLLKPSVDRPADFDSFWQSKLSLLASIPMNPQLTSVPSDRAGVDLYTVKLDSVDSHVQGYLAKPSKPGKYPALLMYEYAGVHKLRPADSVDRAEAGWLAFNVDSHDIPPTESTGAPMDYYEVGNRDREKCYFLDMYLRDARAIDYIVDSPDWDGKTIVLVGTSMGGQQGLAVAALNRRRVTAVIVNEPSGADTNGSLHGRKAGNPYWPSSDPQVMKTSLYFDPVNFAPLIEASTIVAVGFIDTTCPPVGVWTLINQITAPKEIVPMIESGHSYQTPEKQLNFTHRSEEALNILLHGGDLRLH